MKRLFLAQECGVSLARLWVMRALFLIIAALFGPSVWTTLYENWGTFEPLEGVAYSFWGALCILALIGVRYPIKMLPVLLIQLLYKTIWLLAVGYPMLEAGPLDEHAASMMDAMRYGVVLDLVAIPGLYVARQYFLDFFRSSGP